MHFNARKKIMDKNFDPCNWFIPNWEEVIIFPPYCLVH